MINKWERFAKDTNSPFIRNYLTVNHFFRYPELMGTSVPSFGIFSHKNDIIYICMMDKWKKVHEELKSKQAKDHMFIKSIINKANKTGEEMNNFTKNLVSEDLKNLSAEEIIKIIKKFADFDEKVYSYGIVLPLLDLEDFSFVETSLMNILKKNFRDEKDLKESYEIFTFPLNYSFAKGQEIDLLGLLLKYYAIREYIFSKSLTEIKNDYPDFYNSLKKHTERYAWIYYVYAGPAYAENNFLEIIKDIIRRGMNPKNELDKIERQNIDIKKKKVELIKKINPNETERAILELASLVVWAKPRRKDYQSISYYHMEFIFNEIGRRLKINLEQVRSMPLDMLEKSLKEGKISKNNLKIINEILEYHLCYEDGKEIKILYGNEAKRFLQEDVKEEATVDKDIMEIKGTTACRGKARGHAKIVNSTQDMDKMNEGDILISAATTPAIVPAMKKASAIIADEGGLTCHAAIVSRELNTPCVVGTKIATKVLKDGDLIEVDADKGIVKVLERAK